VTRLPIEDEVASVPGSGCFRRDWKHPDPGTFPPDTDADIEVLFSLIGGHAVYKRPDHRKQAVGTISQEFLRNVDKPVNSPDTTKDTRFYRIDRQVLTRHRKRES
jgi:hypothetical protein